MFIKDLLRPLVNQYKLSRFNRKWRKANPHNYTTAISRFPIEQVKVGKSSYGPLNVLNYQNANPKLTIGNYCSIAANVVFLLAGEHQYTGLSTYPFKPLICNHAVDSTSKGAITIGDDVWIGYGCTILSGVTIGQGAVIAAGSIVAKDVPPYAIYATNKIIKYRFSPEIIEKLLKFDFSKLEDEDIKNNIELLMSDINDTIFEHSLFKKCLKS